MALCLDVSLPRMYGRRKFPPARMNLPSDSRTPRWSDLYFGNERRADAQKLIHQYLQEHADQCRVSLRAVNSRDTAAAWQGVDSELPTLHVKTYLGYSASLAWPHEHWFYCFLGTCDFLLTVRLGTAYCYPALTAPDTGRSMSVWSELRSQLLLGRRPGGFPGRRKRLPSHRVFPRHGKFL